MRTPDLRRAALAASAALPLDGSGLAPAVGHEQPVASAPTPRRFALVELFTSEGCSSCPPADDVLADVDEIARRSGPEAYALSFHVDYWNDLGWADPFSDPANTRRQQSYPRAPGGGTYTPEMVVNGAEAFVGGDRARAQRTIEGALARPSNVTLALAVEGSDDRLTARYRVVAAPPGCAISVAWVERERRVEVRRGENAGRRLRHANVVRSWTSLPLGADGAGFQTVRVPPDAPPGTGEVVAWVQAPTLRVLAAARTSPR